MSAGTLEDIFEMVPEGEPVFPHLSYDADGDCLEFISKNENYYGERLDSLVTIYRSRETKEIVGSLVKGVRKYLQKLMGQMPGFAVEIRDGKFQLSQLFTYRKWESHETPVMHAYQLLQKFAEEHAVEASIEGVSGGRVVTA